MTLEIRCDRCDAPLPPDAPHGLCPRCLLTGGLRPPPVLVSTTPPGASFNAPEPAALAPLFPQLDVLELLGQGGMGAVYKVRQVKLDRLVALKVLPPEVGQDPAFAERFTREARALARLGHPHVVGVHDFGESGGLFYLLMEYVEGGNLREAMAGGRLVPAEALAVVGQVCDALEYAHAEGVVHRDVKPENILLDGRGRVKVADFGLAKLAGGPRREYTLTGSRQVVGTLDYMAPEQRTRPQEVDHRADVYSVGVVLYELLTGELPLGRFAPPSQQAPVDPRLDAVVFRALERDPERRYQRVSEVQRDLVSAAAGASRSAAGASPSAAGAGWEPDLALAAHQLRGPAAGLLFAAVLAPIGWALVACVYAAQNPLGLTQDIGHSPLPGLLGFIAWSLFASGLVAAGAMRMRRLESFELAVLAAVLALTPVTTLAFPVSLVMGFWALLILRKPEVRAAFASNLRRSALRPAPVTTAPKPGPLPRRGERGLLRPFLTFFYSQPAADPSAVGELPPARGQPTPPPAPWPEPVPSNGAAGAAGAIATGRRPTSPPAPAVTGGPRRWNGARWVMLAGVAVVVCCFLPWADFRLQGYVANEVGVTNHALCDYVVIRPFAAAGYRSLYGVAAGVTAAGLVYVLLTTGAMRLPTRWHGWATIAAGALVAGLVGLYLLQPPRPGENEWVLWHTGTRNLGGILTRSEQLKGPVQDLRLRQQAVEQYSRDMRATPGVGAYLTLGLGVVLLLLGAPSLRPGPPRARDVAPHEETGLQTSPGSDSVTSDPLTKGDLMR